MKQLFSIALCLIPFTLFAQLERDGKTEIAHEKQIASIYPHTILFSGSTNAPFGFKYQYCRSFGAYVSYKTDFGLFENNIIPTLGITKSVGMKTSLFLGGGLVVGDFAEEFVDYTIHKITPWVTFETGLTIRIRRVAIEFGFGLTRSLYERLDADIIKYKPSAILSFGTNL